MRFSIVIAIVILGLSGLARAQQPGSVFEVPRVPVSAEADSASAAQQIARDRGRRRAMDILLRRLTAQEDWIYLPQLVYAQAAPVEGGGGVGEGGMEDVASGAGADRSADRPMPVEPDGGIGDGAGPPRGFDTGPMGDDFGYVGKTPVDLDPSMLPSLEEGFSVFDEKSSARSYSAKITYRFKAGEVRALLKNARIPYSESQTRMALVIPVLETNNGSYLWETNNPWARAWLARSLTNELTPMMLPRGDDTDMALLPIEAALEFDQEALQEMAGRYNVSQVLVAHAFLHEEDEQYRLRVRLLDAFVEGEQRAAADFDASNAGMLYDDGVGFGEDGMIQSEGGEMAGRMLIENFFRDQAGDFPALAQRAVETTVNRYAAGWKAQTLVDHSVSRRVTVNVWFDSLDDMRAIRQGLEASPIVEDITVELSGMSGGTMTIEVAGDLDQLTTDLRERNLVFWTRDGRVWNIATPEKAEEVREQGLALEGPLPDSVAGTDSRAPGGDFDFSPPIDRERLRVRPRSEAPQDDGNGEPGGGGVRPRNLQQGSAPDLPDGPSDGPDDTN